MEARDVLKRPVITERSSEQMEFKKYTFEVDTRANKTHVKQAVEEIFGVKVEKVNVHELQREVQTYGQTCWIYKQTP